MNLVLDKWKREDISCFQSYLKGLERTDKIEWTKKIINTNMPLLAIPTPELRRIAKEIARGNYLSFLEYGLNDYYENAVINGTLITKIKDFNKMQSYLDKYSLNAENWAVCDLLSFNIKDNEESYYKLSLDYIKSRHIFTRRIGVIIWFSYINDKNYLLKIFNEIKQMKDESEYYVNMALSWFIAECFIKQRELTIEFLELNCLNKFTANKMVQKCRDSFRVSKEDKKILLKYKIK